MTQEETAEGAVVSATSGDGINGSSSHSKGDKKLVPSPKKKSRSRTSKVQSKAAPKSDGNSTADDNTSSKVRPAGESSSSTKKSDMDNSQSSTKSKRTSKIKKNGVSKDGAGDPGNKDVPWKAQDKFESDGEWQVENVGKDSPSVWDPDSFVKQTAGTWKESDDEPGRVQDIPSPSLADAPPQRVARDEEEWPFKSPCAFHGKKGKTRTPRSGQSAFASDIESVDSNTTGSLSGHKPSPGFMSDESTKRPVRSRGGGGKKSLTAHPRDGGRTHRTSKDAEPSRPTRSRGPARPGNDDDYSDQPPSKPKSRPADETDKANNQAPQMPRRRGNSRSDQSEEGENEGNDELTGGNSFHSLVEDCDKPRSKKKGKRGREVRGRRQKGRDLSVEKVVDASSGDDDVGSYEEFGSDDIEEYQLKGEDEEPACAQRSNWRERRANNRLRSRERTSSADGDNLRRVPSSRRAIMRRAQSERWRMSRELSDDGSNDGERRGRAYNNAELSRSAHSIRRYNSGGLASAGLERRSYHGESRADRLERRVRKHSSSESLDSGSNHSYDLSGRSQRTLDSIEDLEDFEHIDFQTPGMIDVEGEIVELMGRPNPEDTAQLNRRVHRQRGRLIYDQNMPLMTRQALMTRQGSAQVMRGRVDTSNMDRQRFMLRTDSMNSVNSKDEMAFSGHGGRRARPAPGGRRPPPRTRSSGLAGSTEIPRFLQQAPRESGHEPDRRQLFRTRSTTTTNSFRQYQNKPNKVAQLSRRTPSGHTPERSSSRVGAPMSGGRSDRPIKPIQRAKSTTALRRPVRRDPRITPERSGVPSTIEAKADATPAKDDQMPDLKSTSSDSDEEAAMKTAAAARRDDASIKSEDSESSSVDSDTSPKKAPRRKSKEQPPPKAAPAPSPPKPSPRRVMPLKSPPTPKKNLRDMTKKSNRRKLHSLLYSSKMGINMSSLFKEVKNGETNKNHVDVSSPLKSP